MLNIQHFTKTYGEKRAVDDLSLHIAPGEIYGFIGHNGAGKTTTLKAAVGILQFDAGEITIGGHSIQTEPLACKRLLAYIPDNPDLYDFMSGIQYLHCRRFRHSGRGALGAHRAVCRRIRAHG